MYRQFSTALASRLSLLLLVVAFSALPAPEANAADSLKVIVVDGDEAANIVAERIAAEPVIEVRDKDDRRVPGAVVRFVIRKTRDRLVASFGNGQTEVRTLTDFEGRAAVNAVTPVEPGSFQIDVDVSYRGQTGKAVIRQTNFQTSAQAKAAGREPGKSTNSNAQTSTSAATASTAAGAAATATGTTATTATTAAVSAGGGVSKLAVIGLVAGGAAGAGAAVVLSQKKTELPAGSIGTVNASVTTGLQASTAFTFSVQAANFEASSINYRWDFGDGETSTEAAPQHVYAAAGTYAVAVTVRDARQSARSEVSVQVSSAQGTWFNGALGPGTTLELTQSGSTIVGTETAGGYNNCPITGTVRSGSPQIVLTVPRCSHSDPQFGPLGEHEYRFNLLPDGRLSGEVDYNVRLLIVVFVRR
jgi:hypothetical protein